MEFIQVCKCCKLQEREAKEKHRKDKIDAAKKTLASLEKFNTDFDNFNCNWLNCNGGHLSEVHDILYDLYSPFVDRLEIEISNRKANISRM